MARANNGGWDFIKKGNSYQYKEDGWIAMVRVVKDNSDSECYRFDLEVERQRKIMVLGHSMLCTARKWMDIILACYNSMNDPSTNVFILIRKGWIIKLQVELI